MSRDSRQSVHLTTLFPGQALLKKVDQYFVHIIQQSFLNQRKEENDRRNYFMINLHERLGPSQDRTHNP